MPQICREELSGPLEADVILKGIRDKPRRDRSCQSNRLELVMGRSNNS